VAALCRSYTSHAEALEAVNAVLGAGIAGEGVLVLTGEPERDAREEQVGEFAGPTAPGAPVGEFAGGSHPQGHEEGHFAGGEQQRGGSFADADREQVISYPEGVKHTRVAGHHKVKRLLTDAGLDKDTAERDVDALHAGRVLVLVEAREEDTARVGALLDA
jgi:hypothetical protein